MPSAAEKLEQLAALRRERQRKEEEERQRELGLEDALHAEMEREEEERLEAERVEAESIVEELRMQEEVWKAEEEARKREEAAKAAEGSGVIKVTRQPSVSPVGDIARSAGTVSRKVFHVFALGKLSLQLSRFPD